MMSDMKEFWEQIEDDYTNPYTEKQEVIEGIKERQFVFLWERGGKQFIEHYNGDENFSFDFLMLEADHFTDEDLFDSCSQAQDFLDCVAIDEERVKELIKQKGEL